MARPRLNEQEIQVLSAEVSEHITPVVLERGLDYYQRGRVSNIQVSAATIIATVRGSENYYVVIDKEWFALGSGCSCPYESLCKHIAAVFFAAYADFGDPVNLLQEWSDLHGTSGNGLSRKNAAQNTKVSARSKSSTPANSTAFSSPSRRTVVTQDPVLQMPAENSSFAEWEAYLEQNLAEVVDRRSAYENDWQRRYEKIVAKMSELLDEADAWSHEQHAVYRTLAWVVVIRRVLMRVTHNGMTEHHWYFNAPPLLSLARELVRNLELDLSSCSEDEVLQIPLHRARELDLFLRSFMASELTNTTVSVEVVQIIWLRVLRHLENPNEVVAEWLSSSSSSRSVAEDQAQDTQGTIRDERTLRGMGISQARAITMLYVLGGADAAAKRGLSENPHFDWDYALMIPSLLLDLSAGDRTLDWLQWMGSKLSSDDRTMIYRLSELWMRVGYLSEQAADEALQFLRSQRTSLGYHYSQGLIQFGRYKTWIDLQMLNGFFPNQIGKENMKLVEAAGLDQLLPLYHQAVERMVAQKNRSSYRIAARWLKKLRTYYKKLKRTDEWDGFVMRFKDQHSRLRALQEELVRAGISQ